MLEKNKINSLKKQFHKSNVAESCENSVPTNYVDEKGLFKTNSSGSGQIYRLEEITSRLAKSEAGKELLDFLYENDYHINLSGTIGNNVCGKVLSDKKVVLLNEKLNNDDLIGTLAHEARHAKQHVNSDNLLYTLSFSPETSVALNHIKEADADAYSAFICWQLKENGDFAVWDKAHYRRPDVCKALQFSLKNGNTKQHALNNAFDAWFKNEYIVGEYSRGFINIVNSCYSQYPLNFADESSFSKVIPVKKIIENICGCDGNNYFKGNIKNPKYQYMPREHLTPLQFMMNAREKNNNVKCPEGLKILWKNLEKIEKPKKLKSEDLFNEILNNKTK